MPRHVLTADVQIRGTNFIDAKIAWNVNVVIATPNASLKSDDVQFFFVVARGGGFNIFF